MVVMKKKERNGRDNSESTHGEEDKFVFSEHKQREEKRKKKKEIELAEIGMS